MSTCLAIDLAIADLREPLIVLNSLSRPWSSLSVSPPVSVDGSTPISVNDV